MMSLQISPQLGSWPVLKSRVLYVWDRERVKMRSIPRQDRDLQVQSQVLQHYNLYIFVKKNKKTKHTSTAKKETNNRFSYLMRRSDRTTHTVPASMWFSTEKEKSILQRNPSSISMTFCKRSSKWMEHVRDVIVAFLNFFFFFFGINRNPAAMFYLNSTHLYGLPLGWPGQGWGSEKTYITTCGVVVFKWKNDDSPAT